MSDDVLAYLAQFPDQTQQRLQTLRGLVRERCPAAAEGMSYGLIGYKLNGHPVIYFGGFKQHIGLYATPAGQAAFAEEFAPYVQGKGSVQLPLTEPLPIDLITRVISHRVESVSDELPQIGRPARAALESIGVARLSQLGTHSEQELLALHGVGPKALRTLRESGARFREGPVEAQLK
ncbi:DUF1801 domain-containing protein [Leucobacter sp. HY1908]